MITVISNKFYMPEELYYVDTTVELVTYDEFIEKATSDDGFDMDEAMYLDNSCTSKEVKEALITYSDMGIKIEYFDSTSEYDAKKKQELLDIIRLMKP